MSDETKETSEQQSTLDEMVEMIKTLPVPCRVFVRSDLQGNNGKPCAMFVGLVPLKNGNAGPDKSFSGKVFFLPDEIIERPEFKGWLIEDVLKHGF